MTGERPNRSLQDNANGSVQWAVILGCGLLSVLGSALIWQIQDEAKHLPEVQDEFSYLLAADTFLEGRVANPTPEHWEFFETMHVLVRPTYASKYPPAQGAVLALGKLVTGRAISGAWLTTALAVSAVAWLLFLSLPFRWATMMSIVALLQIGITTDWSQSYWGGSVAALGGVLLVAAALRSFRRPRLLDGLLLGGGLVILANSRPFEGLLLSIAVAAWAGFNWARSRNPWRVRFLRRVAGPGVAMGLAGLVFVGWYNHRVTGSATTFPHAEYQAQYGMSTGHFLFQPVRDPLPNYQNDAMRAFHRVYGLQRLRNLRKSPVHVILDRAENFAILVLFFLGPAAIGLVGLLGVSWSPRLRWAAATTSLMLVAVLMTPAAYPHYFAPAAGLLYLVAGVGLGEGVRRLTNPKLGVAAILAATALVTTVRAVELTERPATAFERQRLRVLQRLQGEEGEDLVFVRYGPGHNVLNEWVYNAARIDSAEIIWARDRGDGPNMQLAREYPNRQTWLLVDDGTVTLDRYRLDLISRHAGTRDPTE